MPSAKLDISKPLPEWAENAARLEAEGMPIGEIPAAVGVGRQALSKYRNTHPKYVQARTEALQKVLDPQSPALALARIESIDAFRKAVAVSVRILSHQVDGVDSVGHQLEAAKTLINSPMLKAIIGGVEDGEQKAQAVASAAATFIIVRGDGDTIDGAVIEDGEVTDVGHWEGNQEGTHPAGEITAGDPDAEAEAD